jgi:hypothetical protein
LTFLAFFKIIELTAVRLASTAPHIVGPMTSIPRVEVFYLWAKGDENKKRIS